MIMEKDNIKVFIVVKNNKNIAKVEPTELDNKYYCSVCGTKIKYSKNKNSCPACNVLLHWERIRSTVGIIGLKMPKSCLDCKLYYETITTYGEKHICAMLGYINNETEKKLRNGTIQRLPNCPCKELE